MSGIVGIVGLDRAPVDCDLLRRLTQSLRFRGPDGENHWVSDCAGLGHTLLRATSGAVNEKQPCSLDGKAWIVADARVDDRAELIRKLEAGDRRISPQTTDAELILHAYSLWGDDCIEHLIGDYAFAIWDQKRRHLFCARDHLGVKPFYYALTDRHLIFGNTLNCLRLHPDVSDELDERAIGDFLLFGFNQDRATTTFADIRRLPGGHTLTFAGTKPKIARYWEAPINSFIRYQRADEYGDHFRALFRSAVFDRLRTDRIGVLMSGGMDSTAIAAIAHELLAEQGKQFRLKAFTTVYDDLIPDDERRYAQLTGDSLGIPVDFTIADDCVLYEGWDQSACRRPEPVNEPDIKIFADQLGRVSSEFPVLLTGWDGDALLNELASEHFASLIGSLKLIRWVSEICVYFRFIGRRPPFGLRTALARAAGKNTEKKLSYPLWLNPAFAARVDANSRLAEIMRKPPRMHSLRPRAHAALSLPVWTHIFEFYDPGATELPLEVRHPLVDLRLVNFLLSLPPVPFCMDKYLLRRSMRDLLPDKILLRPKTPLAKDPILQLLRNGQGQQIRNYRPSQELSRFVHAEGIFDNIDEMDSEEAEAALRVVSLDRWMNGLYSIE